MFPLLCFHLLKSAGASSSLSVSRVREFHRTSLRFWHNISNTWYTLSVTWKLCSWLQLYSLAAHAQTTAYSIFFFQFTSFLSFFLPSFCHNHPVNSWSESEKSRKQVFRGCKGVEISLSVSWFGDVTSLKALEATHARTHTDIHRRYHNLMNKCFLVCIQQTLCTCLWEDKQNYCTVTVFLIRAWDSCENKTWTNEPVFFCHLPRSM